MPAFVTVTALPLAALVMGSVLVAGLISASHGLSFLLGGLALLIPNAVFALYAFRFGGASNAKRIMHSFYIGEGMKLVLTMVVLAVILKTYEGLRLAHCLVRCH